MPARSMQMSPEEEEMAYSLFLLTSKPVIYVANIDEAGIGANNDFINAVYKAAEREDAEALTICARVEEEIAELAPQEKAQFIEELGIGESGLDRLVRACYRLLGLISYLTAGPKEVQRMDHKARDKGAAGRWKNTHGFERGFIRAEVVNYDTLMQCGSMQACKEKGMIRSEGKEYVVQDGDIVLFRFNV